MQVMKENKELNKKKNEKAPKLINKVKNIKTAVKKVAGFNPDTQYWERVKEITLGDGVVSKVVYKYPSMNDKLKCSNTYVLESYINGNKQAEISYVDGEIIYKKEYYPNGKLEVEYVCFGENEKLKEAYETTTKKYNRFKEVIESIKWDNTFIADGEQYYIKNNLTLTIENIDPFSEAWKPTVWIESNYSSFEN